MNISKTYFGFSDNKKPLTASRIESTLDKQFRYDEGIMSQKQFVYNRLQKRWKLEKKEGYSYYSAKIDGYTKPRTLYKLEADGFYVEINKTVYDFCLYLIEHDFLNEEKAASFIEHEQRQQKAKEQAEQERAERERLKQEQQREKQERVNKEEREKKIKQWETIGRELMTDDVREKIKNAVKEHWAALSNMTNNSLETFTEQYINSWPAYLGNKAWVDSNIKYFIENEKDGNSITLEHNPKMYLQKKVLFAIFSNVEREDDPRTISAKIRHFYNHTEYKQAAMDQGYLFYWFNGRTRQFVKAYGQKVKIAGYVCYIRKAKDNNRYVTERYSIIEGKSGVSLGWGESRQKAIDNAKTNVSKHIDKMNELIANQVKQTGISPLYQNKEIINI